MAGVPEPQSVDSSRPYGAASWALIGVAGVFLGPGASTASGVLLWNRRNGVSGSAVAAAVERKPDVLPLASASSSPGKLRSATLHHRLGVATHRSGSPFPGTGWFGIVGVLALIGSLRVCPRPVVLAAAVLASAANIVYPGGPAPPLGWEGVNTSFGGIGSDTDDPVASFKVARAAPDHSEAGEAGEPSGGVIPHRPRKKGAPGAPTSDPPAFAERGRLVFGLE
jgi:hypothetical protein